MTTPNGTAPAAPAIDTDQACWAYLLTLWHTHSLPAPYSIAVEAGDIFIRMPKDARDGVDRWAAAMDCDMVAFRDDGEYFGRKTTGPVRRVTCSISRPAEVLPPELATAAEGVASMLGGGRDE